MTSEGSTRISEAVPSEVVLFIELLTMIISGQSPALLPSSYITVIIRNDNQRHLI